MLRRSAAVLSIMLFGLSAKAQDAHVPEAEPAKVNFLGEINSDNVQVRSGPSENYYACMKLERGSEVSVVGIKFDWLKIAPPKGAFSYVAKTYVDKATGKVNRSGVNVRAGSNLVAASTSIQMQLDEGTKVDIIGEQDQYYKITPPPGAYFYVSKQFVTPVRALAGGEIPVAPEPTTRASHRPTAHTVATTQRSTATEEPVDTATNPETETPARPAAPVARQKSADYTAAQEQLTQAESDFQEAMKQPIEQQPIGDLLSRYQQLAENSSISGTQKAVIKSRITFLESRQKDQQDIAEVKKTQEESNARLEELRKQQESLQTKGQKPFAAVGTLQTSQMNQNGVALLRLVDPSTGRTLVYVHANDGSLPDRIGQFIAVRGDVNTDEGLNIKVITPTWVEQVDPADLNKSYTATIAPPSLLQKEGQ